MKSSGEVDVTEKQVKWRTPMVFGLTLVLCVGGLMYASWDAGRWQAVMNEDRSRATSNHLLYAQSQIEQNCTGLAADQLTECVSNEITSAVDYSRAESDLDAQQAMAFWAKLMTLAGIAGSLVTGGGLYLVWRTLHVTTDAAMAAVASNDIMRNEQRPWVTLEWQVPCRMEEVNDGATCSISWLYNFKNEGKSPAFNIRHDYWIYRLDTGMIGVGHIGLDWLFEKYQGHFGRRSNNPILFSGQTTDHLWPHMPSSFRIEGHEKGELHLCSVVSYNLDSAGSEIGIEARVYLFEELEDHHEVMSHKLLRSPGYDRIRTWRKSEGWQAQ